MKESTGSLLFVEDDVIVRDIICSFIAARYPAMIIDSAGSADEALALYERQRHGILLTDVNLIDSDGVVLARAIRERAPETVVIFITGSSDTEQLTEFGKSGPGHIIIKPVECEVLFGLLGQYLTDDGFMKDKRQ